jgi:hypothetical protein
MFLLEKMRNMDEQLTEPLSMPGESTIMPKILEGMSTDFNKAWLRLILFLATYKIKSLPFSL